MARGPVRRPAVGALAWSAYVIVPIAGWGWLQGIPLSAPATLALAAIWLNRSARSPVPAAPIAVALVAVKLIAAFGLADRGLAARYYANDAWRPPLEHSTHLRRDDITRIDSALHFGPDARQDLPLFFLNDLIRFNFYQPSEPARAALPYSVTWTGELRVDDDKQVTMFLRGRGIRGRIAVDGVDVVRLNTDDDDARGALRLARGWRHLLIEVAAPQGAGRSTSAGFIDGAGVDRAFGVDDVFVTRVPLGRLRVDRTIRAISRGIDSVVLACLGGWTLLTLVKCVRARDRRARLVLLSAVAIADALRSAWPWAGRLMLLDGGSDMLTYEWYARDIVRHGPLMTLGRTLGRGESFYYQPLYPYTLALEHLAFGEGFFGIVFVQRLLIAVAAWALWRITAHLFGERVGAVGAGMATVFLYATLGPWASVLLGEVVFVPLLCLWTWGCIRLADRTRRSTAIWTGLAGGAATLSRSTLLLAWPVAAAVVSMTPARGGDTRRHLRLAAATMGAVVSLATLRNAIVAREFVPITTSFAINFYLGNTPPPDVPVHGAGAHAIYRWIARDDRTRMALEFARHAPLAFARNLARKAAYTLGFFGAFVEGGPTMGVLVAVWMLALAGAALVAAGRMPDGRGGVIRVLPGAIAGCHFAAVVLIFPHVYGDRLILPFYALLLPYAAVAAAIPLRAWDIRWKPSFIQSTR